MGEAVLKLYSILADAAGRREIRVPCLEGEKLRSLIERAASEAPGLGEALNVIEWSIYGLTSSGERVELDDKAPCGEIHLVPPPSGGSRLVKARLLDEDETVDIASVVAEAGGVSSDTGAVAVFVGIVKGLNSGVVVEKLYYDAARGVAERVIEAILREEAERHDLRAAIVLHYTGNRYPGDVTFIAVVSGRGRRNVFPALEAVVERVKREAPIWKVEYRADGSKAYILGDRVVKLEAAGGEVR